MLYCSLSNGTNILERHGPVPVKFVPKCTHPQKERCALHVLQAALSGLVVEHNTITHSGGSSGGAGGHAPRWRPGNCFRQYINIITKSTAYDGPREY